MSIRNLNDSWTVKVPAVRSWCTEAALVAVQKFATTHAVLVIKCDLNHSWKMLFLMYIELDPFFFFWREPVSKKKNPASP